MNNNSNKAGSTPAPVLAARQLAAQAEAAIADLEERVPTGIGAFERALAERIRAAIARLLECSEQLATDGLMVDGSTGQRRPHQLLKVEQELRREIDEALQRLTFRAEQGASFVQARDMTRRRRGESA
jgi:hypothetical protein